MFTIAYLLLLYIFHITDLIIGLFLHYTLYPLMHHLKFDMKKRFKKFIYQTPVIEHLF